MLWSEIYNHVCLFVYNYVFVLVSLYFLNYGNKVECVELDNMLLRCIKGACMINGIFTLHVWNLRPKVILNTCSVNWQPFTILDHEYMLP